MDTTKITFDIKKTTQAPSNVFQAIDLLIKANNDIMSAWFIMLSALQFPDETEYHKRKMEEFIRKYAKEVE